MHKITEEQIKGITNYLLFTMLPSKEVQQIIKILNTLPKIEEPKNEWRN